MQSSDPHARREHAVEICFHAELSDFLPDERRRRAFIHHFVGTPSVKDTIEAIGVPHTEVDVILIDGRSVDFSHLLHGGEHVDVYPRFERHDITPLIRLRPPPLPVTRFIADVHLGTLVRNLRLLGFDTIWSRDLADQVIIDIAVDQERVILTRDKGILKNGRVTYGYWLRSTDPIEQMEAVVATFDLGGMIAPYTRCMECNGRLEPVERSEVAPSVPLQVFLVFRDFRRCADCLRIYWSGSHLDRLDQIVERARSVAPVGRNCKTSSQ